jgi:DNA-binding LacI/PurR family transcriptional regulator
MTITEIAKALRISHSTVSRALNPEKSHLISEPVRLRIERYASKSRYVPNRPAQELVRGRSHTIGVILSTVFTSVFFSDYLAKVLSGIYAVIQQEGKYGCKLIVLPRETDLQSSDLHILRTGIDGLLVSSIGDFAQPAFARLSHQLASRGDRPVVVLGIEQRRSRGLGTVSFDNQEAARQGVRYLVQKGHKRIGLIWADNGSPDLVQRVEGYRKALGECGLPASEELIARGNLLSEGGFEAARLLLKPGKSRPTALFCINDEMAIGAIQAIQAAGLRCPEDLAVMGFDGLELGKLLAPSLTTLRQPVREMAEEATRHLIDLIEGKQKAKEIRLAAELISRHSA